MAVERKRREITVDWVAVAFAIVLLGLGWIALCVAEDERIRAEHGMVEQRGSDYGGRWAGLLTAPDINP